MKRESSIKLFEQKQVRTHWSEDEGKWYFSVIDVVEVLTESTRPRKYWNALKTKLKEEGSQLSSNMGHLKMKSADGKYFKTDAPCDSRTSASRNFLIICSVVNLTFPISILLVILS